VDSVGLKWQEKLIYQELIHMLFFSRRSIINHIEAILGMPL
jgi:hypothetical protein